ncbi:MAG: hybrid sensor histidine kinase/response regulator, partial [Gammaproteobacteria bacterium]
LSEHRPEAATPDFDPLEFDRYTRIHELSRSLSEAVVDLTSLRSLFATELRQASVLLDRQGRVNAEMQDALMRTRMVPFALSASRLRRVVRQIAEESGKRVELELSGMEGEMDRQLLGHILPALEHLLRNAVVHGIESPALRASRDKPETGRIELALRRDGGDMLIEVSDDGGGLDLDAIRDKAVADGIVAADAPLTEEEIAALVYRPGFSTAASVTQSAGRGVGMDVVAAEVRQVGGSTEIQSTPLEGMCCRMRLPATLAITQILLVRIGVTLYPVALASITGVARPAREELARLLAEQAPGYEYGGERYELVSLARILGEAPPPPDEQAARQPLLLVDAGGRRIALIAEDMEGSREVVVKPIGPQLARVPGLAGATVFGDGSIGLLLDLSALVRALPQMTAMAEMAPQIGSAQEAQAGPLIMVVDDSITVRRVTRRLLERNGARVLTAKDGVEALELLQDYRPDVILLDIEMPRMDGYELAGHIKNDARLREIAIIVITSRTGEKHRARAHQIGIENYLGKPYQDADLIAAISALVPDFAVAPVRMQEEQE